MAERASLKRPKTLVNLVPAFVSIFLLSGCLGEDKSNEPVTIKNITSPIIWQTSVFDEKTDGFALSAEPPLQLMLVLERSGLHVIDIDGANVSEKSAPFFPVSISNGVNADFDGAELKLFFGADEKSDGISAFAFGDGLLNPNRVQIQSGVTTPIAGVCASPSDTDGTIARIGFWTQLDNTSLVVGELRTNPDSELQFIETERVRHEKYLTSCALDKQTIVTGGGFGVQIKTGNEEPTVLNIPGVPVSLSTLADGDESFVAMTLSGGKVYIADSRSHVGALTFKAGLSTKVPESAGTVALSGSGVVGSLPNGFLAVESILPSGTQIIYVDLENLKTQLKS